MKLLHMLLAIIVLVTLCRSAPAVAAEGPLSAVSAAQRAVDASDTNAFNAAVDVDALLQKGLDDGLAVLCEQSAKGTLPSMEPVLALAVAGVASDCRPENPQVVVVRGLLQSEAKSAVAAGVGGGYFAGKPNGKVSETSLHGRLLKNMSTARKQLVPGAVLSQTTDTAEVSATLHDAEAGSFPLRLKVERKNAAWRITEVLNARELALDALARQR